MMQLLVRIVSSLGAIATAAGVIYTASPGTISTLFTVALWAVVAIAIVAIIGDIVSYVRERPRNYDPNSNRIVKYLCKWLTSGGRTAVFSRDLSWATEDSEAAGILERKAASGELLVFVGRQTPFIRKLAELGADVHDYSSLGFEPQARFTVIDYGKAGARVAIGFVENNKHLIRQFGTDNHAVLALASDLVSITSRIATKIS